MYTSYAYALINIYFFINLKLSYLKSHSSFGNFVVIVVVIISISIEENFSFSLLAKG